jgi:MFS-type transporter involved in bile tolerance (Atg22 family)
VIRGNVLVVGLISLLTDRSSEMIFPLLPIFVAGLVPLALVYLGLAFMTTEAHLWILVAAYVYGLVEGAGKALVADLVPPAQRGTAFGFFHAAVGLAAPPARAG